MMRGETRVAPVCTVWVTIVVAALTALLTAPTLTTAHFTQSSSAIDWILDSTPTGTSMLTNATVGQITGSSPNDVGSMSRNNMGYSEDLVGNTTEHRGYSFVLARDASFVTTCNTGSCPLSSARVNDAVVGLCRPAFDLSTRQSEFPYRNFPNTAGTLGDDLLLFGFRFYPTVNRLTIVNNGSHDSSVHYCEPSEANCVSAPVTPLEVAAFDHFTMRISSRNTVEFLMNGTLLVETMPITMSLRPCVFLKGTATLLTHNQWIKLDNFGSLRWAAVDASVADLHAEDAQLRANITAVVSSVVTLAQVAATNHSAQGAARRALEQTTQTNFTAATAELAVLRTAAVQNHTAQGVSIVTLQAMDATLSSADTVLNASISVAMRTTAGLRTDAAANHSTQRTAILGEITRAISAEQSLAAALSAQASTQLVHTDTTVASLSGSVAADLVGLRASLVANVSSVIVQAGVAGTFAANDRSTIRSQTSQQFSAVEGNMSQHVAALTSQIATDVGAVNTSVQAHNSTRIAEASAIRSMVLQTEGSLNTSIVAVNASLIASQDQFKVNTSAELGILHARITALESRLDVALAAIATNFSVGNADVATVADGLAATNDATSNNAETTDLYMAVAIGAAVAVLLAVLITLGIAKKKEWTRDLPVSVESKGTRNLAHADTPVSAGRTGGTHMLTNPAYDAPYAEKYLEVSPEDELATSVSGYAPVSYKTDSEYDERSRVADYSDKNYSGNSSKTRSDDAEAVAAAAAAEDESFRRVKYRTEGGSIRPSSIFRENPLTGVGRDDEEEEEDEDYNEDDADSKSAAPSGFGSEITSFPC